MESWYFAYGSNLWIDQMIARTGAIGHADHPPRIAHLADHRLVFQHLEPAGPAYANILCPGDGVLGVVYRCSAAELERLDRYEGGYDRQPVTVIDQQGEVLAATTYVVISRPAATFGRPGPEYLQRIVTGARQHGLPEEYIAQVIRIASAGTRPAGECRI